MRPAAEGWYGHIVESQADTKIDTDGGGAGHILLSLYSSHPCSSPRPLHGSSFSFLSSQLGGLLLQAALPDFPMGCALYTVPRSFLPCLTQRLLI